jgi:DNA adenine methylase
MSKPFLKWAGGKYKLARFIETHLPSRTRKRLIEPFAGSAAVSLSLDFDAYLLNDTNADLIGLFRSLQNQKQEFIAYACSFFTAANNESGRYYELREQFNNSRDTVERAALFVYLNRHTFNGLCRYNSKGGFNVPFGKYKAPYFPEAEMLAFLQKADRIELMCADFQAALNAAGSDDLIYCDPPYAPLSETASFTAYAQNSFNADDQRRLAAAAERAAKQSQGVLISNHDTPFTRDLYRHARLEAIEVQRNIAAKGSSRQKVGEILAVYE